MRRRSGLLLVTVLCLCDPSMLGAQTPAPASSLRSRLVTTEGILSRLIIEPSAARLPAGTRLVVWLDSEAGASSGAALPRFGITAGWLTSGPLGIKGPLREALTPHATSAGSLAWAQYGSAELDTALEPPNRYGVAIAPPESAFGWLAVRTSEGVLSGFSIGHTGGAAADDAAIGADVTALIALPQLEPQADTASLPWFGRSPAPAGTAHLVLRTLCHDPVEQSIRIGAATALSLLQTSRPGTWWRLGLDAGGAARGAGQTESGTTGGNTLEMRLLALLGLSSPAYRLPFSGAPGEAMSFCVRLDADYADLLGATVSARTSAAWRGAALLPGAPFTFRGLAGDDAEIKLTGRASGERWTTRGSLSISNRLPQLGAAVHYETAAVSMEGTARLDMGEETTAATITADLELAPTAAADRLQVYRVPEQVKAFGISASLCALPWEDGLESGVWVVGARVVVLVGRAGLSVRGRTEWDAAAGNRAQFEGDLGFSVATDPE